jgi:hypothetical protein
MVSVARSLLLLLGLASLEWAAAASVPLRLPNTLSLPIATGVVRALEQSTELTSWKPLLLYTPPFDTSVLAKAMLIRRFAILARQHTQSACASYGEAAMETVLFMAQCALVSPSRPARVTYELARYSVPYAMSRPTRPTWVAAEYEARCGTLELPYVAERHLNYINLLPSQLVR